MALPRQVALGDVAVIEREIIDSTAIATARRATRKPPLPSSLQLRSSGRAATSPMLKSRQSKQQATAMPKSSRSSCTSHSTR